MPFVPSDHTNLEAWFKSDTGVTLTGSLVDVWADQSGNGHDFVPSNPLYKASLLTTQINGYPAVVEGTNVALVTDTIPSMAAGTVFVVFRQSNSEPSNSKLLSSNLNFLMGRYVDGIDNDHAGAEVGNGSPMAFLHQAVTDDTWYTIRLRWDGTNHYVAFNNGTEQTAANGGTSLTPDVLALFGDSGNKRVAEIIYYTDNKSVANDRDLVEYYLQQKYNHFTWGGSIPADPSTPSGMASTANSIDGKLVILSISTNLVTPAYKSVVCSINNGLSMQRDVNTQSTKCGTAKSGGSPNYTVTGSLAANTTPGGSEMSHDEIAALADSGASFLWQMEDTNGDYVRSGTGFISSLNETANDGELVQSDFTIEVEGSPAFA